MTERVIIVWTDASACRGAGGGEPALGHRAPERPAQPDRGAEIGAGRADERGAADRKGVGAGDRVEPDSALLAEGGGM